MQLKKLIFLLFIIIGVLEAHSYRDHTHSQYDNNIELMKEITVSNKSSNTLKKVLPKTLSGTYNTILTEHFRIYYGNSNPGTTFWNDSNSNGIADYLDTMKIELEVIWDKVVEEMQFKSPNYGDYIDVFISDTGIILDGSTLSLGDNIVGYSIYDENNGETYMVLNGGIGYYKGTSAEELLKTTLAHEFLHLVQYAYASDNQDFYDKNIWLYEGTAVWMEYQVYPEVDGYIQTYGDYISSVLTKGIVEEGGIYPYSTNYFFDFINKKSSNEYLIKEIWDEFEKNSDSITAVDTVLVKEGKNFYSELINYSESLINKDSTNYTNGTILFDTLDTSSAVGEFSCNSSKTKYLGYYSVVYFDDANIYDNCNVVSIDAKDKTYKLSDGNITLTGTLFNTKANAKGAVVIPNNSITTNSSSSITLKMIEKESYDLQAGWNLLGTSSDINLTQVDVSDINTIWSYENGTWYLSSKVEDNYGLPKLSFLKSGKGFWVSSEGLNSDPFQSSFDKTQVCDFENLQTGWNLVANSCISSLDIDTLMAKYTINSAWVYSGSQWLLRQLNPTEDYGFGTFTTIETNKGYWFYK